MEYTVQYRVHPRVYNDNYEVLENLQELAWRAVARQSQDVPKEIFLREVHELAARQDHRLTVHQVDPLGWHSTVSYKTQQHVDCQTHVTVHAYTKGAHDFDLKSVGFAPEKPDITLSPHRGDSIIWPSSQNVIILSPVDHLFPPDEVDINIPVFAANNRGVPPRSYRPIRPTHSQSAGASSRSASASSARDSSAPQRQSSGSSISGVQNYTTLGTSPAAMTPRADSPLLHHDTPFVQLTAIYREFKTTYGFTNRAGQYTETADTDWYSAKIMLMGRLIDCIAYEGNEDGEVYHTLDLPC